MTIRIVVIEDHALMRQGIVGPLRAAGMEVAAEGDHGSQLMSLLAAHLPHVVLLDLGMRSGLFEPVSAISRARAAFPDSRIIALTSYDDPGYVQEILRAGAQGYLLKDDLAGMDLAAKVNEAVQEGRVFSPRIVEILRAARAPQLLFSTEQLAMLRLMSQGCKSSIEMAGLLRLDTAFVRIQVALVYAMLNIRGQFLEHDTHRAAAVAKALEWRLIVPPATDTSQEGEPHDAA